MIVSPDGDRHRSECREIGMTNRSAVSRVCSAIAGGLALATTALTGAVAQSPKQPNILVIMGDDIGMWNIGAYHRGLMAGTTPNLDRIAKEGMLFTDYYAEASCTAGRANFIT